MTDWFSDEAFWRELYQFLFPERRFQIAEEQVDRIMELTGGKACDILDLACGPGRHAILLAGKGYNVTGVDRSAYLLGLARKKAEELEIAVEWVHQDMRDFSRLESFDLVLNLFTSFGYFDDKNDDMRVLGNICDSLRSDGILVMEMAGKEWLAKNYQQTLCHEDPDGSLLIERHEIYEDWTRIRNEWIVLRGTEARRFSFHHTIYSGQELRDRLIAAGFSDVRLHGGFDGRPYDLDANRLVAVAVK